MGDSMRCKGEIGGARRGGSRGWCWVGVDEGSSWRGRGGVWVGEGRVGETLRAEGGKGDSWRSLVRRQILCVDEPVGVGTTDGGLGWGWCGTAACRGEEAGACAAQMGDDVVDDCLVGDEA